MRNGSFWRDRIGLIWLAAAVLVAATHQWVPESTWLMVHLVLLGALSHAILVWSRHFTHALLRVKADDAEQRRHLLRLKLHSLGALGIFITVPFAFWHATALFAVIVAGAVVWHGIDLWRLRRSALPGRFRVTLWYYGAAALMLPVGATFGVLLASAPGQVWFERLLVAHVAAMVMGWVLLTVVGTLLTFWPTMLRARMDERAERFTQQAFPWLVAGVLLTVAGALLGDSVSVLLGLAVYGFGLLWYGRGLFRPLLVRVPREFAPVSVGAALVWFVVSYLWLVVMFAWQGWDGVADGLGSLLGVVVVGFAAQILSGALSFLIPSVIGGGPSVVRAGQKELHRFATFRLVVINGGLLLWLLPTPSWTRVVISGIVLATLFSFIILAIRAARASVLARRAKDDGAPAPVLAVGHGVTPIWSRRQLLIGAGTLLVGGAAGVAIDPPAAGLPDWPMRQPPVEPTGETTSIRVVAIDMRFEPSSVEVPRGNMLEVTVVNEDEIDSHDLRIGRDQTPRIDPGNEATLDYGPVGRDIQGYCTIVGHRASGMVFDVRVV